jgi:hypothetical protein
MGWQDEFSEEMVSQIKDTNRYPGPFYLDLASRPSPEQIAEKVEAKTVFCGQMNFYSHLLSIFRKTLELSGRLSERSNLDPILANLPSSIPYCGGGLFFATGISGDALPSGELLGRRNRLIAKNLIIAFNGWKKLRSELEELRYRPVCQ